MEQQYELVTPPVGIIGLKLAREERDMFKMQTRSHGTTMQEVLETFVYLYNRNPEVLVIKTKADIIPFQREG